MRGEIDCFRRLFSCKAQEENLSHAAHCKLATFRRVGKTKAAMFSPEVEQAYGGFGGIRQDPFVRTSGRHSHTLQETRPIVLNKTSALYADDNNRYLQPTDMTEAPKTTLTMDLNLSLPWALRVTPPPLRARFCWDPLDLRKQSAHPVP